MSEGAASVWQVGSRVLSLDRPCIMGILNLAPDTFYPGSCLAGDESRAVEAAEQMLDAGADILDFGGESSRPGADPVSAEEELLRVLPPLRASRKRFPEAFISVDTYKAEVARAALDEGADIVNDISGARLDGQMLPLLAQARCGYVLMHMQGVPRSMQVNPYYEDAVREVSMFLEQRLAALESAGVARERVVLDPGIGFGKRVEDNLALIARARELKAAGRPLLFGVSRKSFLGSVLGREVDARLDGTTAVHMFLLLQGASILRVHDVAAGRDAVLTYLAIREHAGSFSEGAGNGLG